MIETLNFDENVLRTPTFWQEIDFTTLPVNVHEYPTEARNESRAYAAKYMKQFLLSDIYEPVKCHDDTVARINREGVLDPNNGQWGQGTVALIRHAQLIFDSGTEFGDFEGAFLAKNAAQLYAKVPSHRNATTMIWYGGKLEVIKNHVLRPSETQSGKKLANAVNSSSGKIVLGQYAMLTRRGSPTVHVEVLDRLMVPYGNKRVFRA